MGQVAAVLGSINLDKFLNNICYTQDCFEAKGYDKNEWHLTIINVKGLFSTLLQHVLHTMLPENVCVCVCLNQWRDCALALEESPMVGMSILTESVTKPCDLSRSWHKKKALLYFNIRKRRE